MSSARRGRRLRKVFCLSDAIIRCGTMDSSEAKESLKSGHRLPATVVPEDELVQVDLELATAYAVVGANEPLLQVTDGSVGQRHDRFGTFAQCGPQWLSAGDRLEPNLFQAPETFEPIGVDGRSRSHVLREEVVDGGRFEVRDDGHAEAPRGSSPLLDGDQHERRPTPLELTAAADPCLSATHPGLVDLHLTMKGLASRVHHRSPQFVKHHPRSLVTSKAKLALEEQRRDAPLVGGHQISGPEPQDQRGLRIMKDGPRGQRDLVTAGGAFPASLANQRVAAPVPASRAHVTLRPAAPSQILLAGLFGGEFKLKLAKSRRKGRTRHSLILPLAAT